MEISEEKAEQVFNLLSKSGDLQDEDFLFLENNLAPFGELLIKCGAHAMVNAGMEKEEALSILETLAMVSRMSGATSFKDFTLVSRMED